MAFVFAERFFPFRQPADSAGCYQLWGIRHNLENLVKECGQIYLLRQIFWGLISSHAEVTENNQSIARYRAVAEYWVPAMVQLWKLRMIRPTSHKLVAALATALVLILFSQSTFAEELSAGTNSRRAKERAIKSIPLQQLNVETQQKLRPILQRPSIYRCLPVTSINIDPDYYLHLVRHPEVVINIWQLMGVTQMTADRTAPYQLETDDGAGTLGNVELVYGTNNLHIYYCEGNYKGSVLPKALRGKCVLVLTTDYKLDEEGNTTAVSRLDVFLKIENATLGLIAKTLHPLIGTTADHNFVESINFLERLNETTVKNGPGVQGMAQRLKSLTPVVRKKFSQVAGLVYDRAETRSGRQSGSGINSVPVHNISAMSGNQNRATQENRGAAVTLQSGYRTGTSPTPAQYSTRTPSTRAPNTRTPSYSDQRLNGQGRATNPYAATQTPDGQRTAQPGWQPQRRPAPVMQNFGDQQPQNQRQESRPIYSTSQRPYKTNPYYNNR